MGWPRDRIRSSCGCQKEENYDLRIENICVGDLPYFVLKHIVVRAYSAPLYENKVCEKVAVTNCNLTSHACAVRVGWINDGVMRL